MTTPLKRIAFEGIANFRDLGGYPVGMDRMTKYGVFYRSTSLKSATAKDLNKMSAMGISTVIDLRFPQEAAAAPNTLAGDERFDHYNISLIGELTPRDLRVNGREQDTATLQYMYRQILDLCRRQIIEVMQTIDAAEGAVLFHCAAGKDRTGLISMLLLSNAGVGGQDLIADYEVSHTYIEDFTSDVSGSNYINMKETLNYLYDDFGSPRDYLLEIGMKPDTLERLKARLVQLIGENQV